jgi:DNA replication ATP-dependent helicase Dna2
LSGGKYDANFELYRREIIARYHHNKRLYEIPIDQAIDTGEVVGPARVVAETGEVQAVGFQFKLRKGDQVKLCVLQNGKLVPASGSAHSINKVVFADVGVVRFGLNTMGLDPQLEYFLVLDYNSAFDWSLRKTLMCNLGERRKADINPKYHPSRLEGLNSGQQNAIEAVLRNQFSGVIQGPPGTGKTEVLARLVEIAAVNQLRVGVLSFTNKAVDNALARIVKLVPEGVVRVGNALKADLAEGIKIVPNLGGLKKFSVFGTTTHSFLLSKNRPAIDIIILDEASQIPSFFLPGLKHACANIVMIGDDQQLPPVMRVGQFKDCAPDCFTTYKNELNAHTMLDTQYRMNETIQDWSSNRYYQGKLKAHERNAKRDIFSHTHTEAFGDSIINYHDQSRGSDMIARQVVEYAKAAKSTGHVNWEDIGIISPHRMHAAQINRRIQEEFGAHVNNEIFADTVDRYQGREKEFIIFTVADNLSDPAAFLNDYRRINVAITRARSRFYVVSDYRLRDGEEFSDFLDWCKTRSGTGNENAA